MANLENREMMITTPLWSLGYAPKISETKRQHNGQSDYCCDFCSFVYAKREFIASSFATFYMVLSYREVYMKNRSG